MRILVHDYPGHPFQVQLSRSLARRGHLVLHVYSGSDITPRGVLRKLPSDPETFDCQVIYLSAPFQKFSFFKRRYQEIEYGRLLLREVDRFSPDVIISANTPLDPQKMLLKNCRANGIKFVYWVQDLIGTAIKKILSRKFFLLGTTVGAYFQRMELELLRASDQLVLITEDFVKIFEKAGIPWEKMHVINNWAPLEELPLFPKDNDWARAFGFEDKLCIIYSGTLGRKHNPELLASLATKLNDRDDVKVVVISEGLGADYLKHKKAELDLPNLFLFDFQPFELLPQVLSTADILVAILEEDAGIFSVPSKVLTYHCAGRALLLSVPADNLAARIVKDNQTGLVIRPRDEAGFMAAAETLLNDAKMRNFFAAQARAYAEHTFNIEKITDNFEKIIFV